MVFVKQDDNYPLDMNLLYVMHDWSLLHNPKWRPSKKENSVKTFSQNKHVCPKSEKNSSHLDNADIDTKLLCEGIFLAFGANMSNR